MLDHIQQTAAFLKQKTSIHPEIGIVLGSGLGALVNEISIDTAIPFEDIPGFAVSTVEGHQGRLIFGTIGNKKVIAMQGRFHYYEGYSMQEITFPIRVMKELGVETLLLSNASGGMNPEFKVGDIMIITDHINLFPDSPLRGKNDNRLGPRFPDMSQVYDKLLISKILEIGKTQNILLKQGVYAGVMGPCFETPAEYRFFYRIGADAVGMSTVPEAIVAVHSGMKCFGISVITDLGIDGQVNTVSHQEVLAAAKSTEQKLSKLINAFITDL